METRKLGKTDIDITTLALGTWVFAGAGWGGAEDKESIATMEKALEAGINFFDSAPVYGNGHSERLLGQVVKDVRSKVIIGTKVINFSEGLEGSLDKSLKRLDTDYVDIFYIHWPVGSVKIEKMMEDMNKVKEKGKIKTIGVSNFSLDQIKRAQKVAQIDALQPPYNLYWRFVEDEIVPHCVETNIAIVSYSVLHRGLLTGKFTPDWKFKKGDSRGKNVLFLKEHFCRALEGVEKIKALAEKKGTTASAVSIKWAVTQKGITSVLIGARRPAQLNENLKCEAIQLDSSDLQQLQSISDEVLDPVRAGNYDNPFNSEGYKKI